MADIRDRVLSRDDPALIISSENGSIMHRTISGDDAAYGFNQWQVSPAIPGARIINTWEIYHRIWLVLARFDDGHYKIFRTVNQRDYTLVHDHETRIHNIFYVDEGHAVFCADDGWYFTVNTGTTWAEADEGVLGPIPDEGVLVPEYDDWTVIDSWWPEPELDEPVPEYDNWTWLGALGAAAYSPVARSMAVIGLDTGLWALIAYAENRKIYRAVYPGGEWEMVYDTTPLCNDKWYAAIAGGPVCVLAGVGRHLLRSTTTGEVGNWSVVHEVEGIIKSIIISDQGNAPSFLIEVETVNTEGSTLHWSYDAGDSLIPDVNRMDVVTAVHSVYGTGTGTHNTMYVVFRNRTRQSNPTYKLIRSDRS